MSEEVLTWGITVRVMRRPDPFAEKGETVALSMFQVDSPLRTVSDEDRDRIGRIGRNAWDQLLKLCESKM